VVNRRPHMKDEAEAEDETEAEAEAEAIVIRNSKYCCFMCYSECCLRVTVPCWEGCDREIEIK
jgi:hypothetical protein